MRNKKCIRILVSILAVFLLTGVNIGIGTIETKAYSYNALSDKKVTLIKGQTKKISLVLKEKNVKWSTSNKKIATVKNGKIKAIKKGKATITAKVSKRKYKCKVTVEEPYISKKNITIVKNENCKLKIKGTKQYCEWYSSDDDVASVNCNGNVVGNKKGIAYAIAEIGNKKYKCKVKVEEPKLSNDKLDFLLDDKPKQIYLNGTTRNITWSTTDESVATVKNGIVTPKGSGYCDIVAKIGGKEYECSVYVKNELNAVYIPMGKSWHVLGQWEIKINSVKETSYRNGYSEHKPEAAYILNYTYRNLGFKDSDGLYFSLDGVADSIVDILGQTGYCYDCDTKFYPKDVPVGAYCTAEAGIGVEHKGNFIIYYSKYDNNGTLRRAIFEVNVPN